MLDCERVRELVLNTLPEQVTPEVEGQVCAHIIRCRPCAQAMLDHGRADLDHNGHLCTEEELTEKRAHLRFYEQLVVALAEGQKGRAP
jgi:hypothetical protein